MRFRPAGSESRQGGEEKPACGRGLLIGLVLYSDISKLNFVRNLFQ
jgi:hypothetical protein